jgi:putative selenium metabolism hydrolase
VTVTDIRSTSPSLAAVADSATIHLDRRLTEGETLETALDQVRALPGVSDAKAEVFVPKYEMRTYTGLKYPVQAYFPAWLMDKSDSLVRKAASTFENQFDRRADVGVWKFSTNGVATKGKYDIPTIGFGPGKEEHAHTPEDQVTEDDLVESMAFYAAFVLGQ